MKLYLWKCKDNRSGAGAVPVYFDNCKAAKEHGNKDYVSYCGRIEFDSNKSTYPEAVYSSSEDVDKDTFCYAWGICPNGKLWVYNKSCPCKEVSK